MANGYSAGDLNITIQTISNETIKSLDAVIERLSLIDKGLGGIKGNSYIRKSDKTPKSNGGAFGFAKLGISLLLMRRMGRFMGDLVQAGSDYLETLNLWQVAMRNNLDVADQFINKMQKAYGISTKTLMNAQAVFKNMIGSLGQISDSTAYALSEALVQMSADYASLYNRTFESAIKNMQSMLAGQVRPIRSAGLDITETTLFQFYKQLGGTKTMRQLNRTEKQLLSILAVYQQMGSAGALGDMTKTINQFANQSRMMTEYWAELKTWSGLLLKDLIDSSGILFSINAFLIVTSEIIKSIAKARGLGEDNFIDGLYETTEATNDAVDELQGKLLDFDKIRSLQGEEQSVISIDEKVLEAIAGYKSNLEDVRNKSEEIAGFWLEILGFSKGSNGEWTTSEDNLETIKTVLDTIAITAGILVAMKLGPRIAGLVSEVGAATIGLKLFNVVLIGGTVFAILRAIDAFEEGEIAVGILTAAIGVSLVLALLKLNGISLMPIISEFWNLMSSMVSARFAALTTGQTIASLSIGFLGLSAAIYGSLELVKNWGDMNTWQRIVSVCGIVTTAVLGLALAFGAFHSSWSIGLAAAGIAAGIAAIAVSFATLKKDIEEPVKYSIPQYAVGASDIDSGTLFVAGEMGKTEAVFSGSNGKTNVANVKQMKEAFYQALVEFSHGSTGSDETFVIKIGDDEAFRAVRRRARQEGLDFVRKR